MVKPPPREHAADPVSRNVSALRADRGWTQEELSAASGVSRQTISNIERGVTEADLQTLRSLAGAFDVPLAALTDDNPGYIEAVRAAAKVARMTPEQQDIFHRQLERERDDYLRRDKK